MFVRPRLSASSIHACAGILALAGCAAGGGAAENLVGGAGAAGDASAAPADGPAIGVTDASSTPGRYLTNATTAGTGPCVGVSLTDVLVKIRAADPALADIVTIYNPAPANTGGDGSFIYPYLRSDGGFDVVFKRGLGDCPAGCTENDYQYWATAEQCRPQRVGHYHAAWGAGSCLTVDGSPMWNHPPAPDPLTVCGQNNAPQAMSGTYQVHAAGQRSPCTTSAPLAKAGSIDATVTIVIKQDAANPSRGVVTFMGTGHTLVDGVALPAQFQRRRFDAALMATNAAMACPRESSVTARYDFEGYQTGGIEVSEMGNDACEVCKGSMNLTLTAAALTSSP